jgi:hypothetical protein
MSKRKPARKATKSEPRRVQRYLIPGYEPAPPSSASDAIGSSKMPADVKHAVEAIAAALAERLKVDAKKIEHRYPLPTPTRSGGTVTQTRRVFVLEESDVDELAGRAAAEGFMLALKHYAADLLKNESVRAALGTARDKANAARLAAKIEKRNRIMDYMRSAAAFGRTISVTQACKELGISPSTGHDAMNHDA